MRFALGLLLGMLLVAASCGDSKPPVVTPDKGTDAPQVKDLPPPGPEAKVPDKFVWPDFPPKDTWPQPHDTYIGAQAFGCQTDSDCFGQKCCPTPWGVKLCAPTCDIK